MVKGGYIGTQRSCTVQKARATRYRGEMDNADIVVEGVPFDANWNIYGRGGGDKHKLRSEHVYWLKSGDNQWMACLKHPITKKLKKISIAMCQSIWPNINTETACTTRVIVRPGLSRPLLPPNFVRFKQRSKKKQSKLSKRRRMQRSSVYNVELRPNIRSQSYFAVVSGFFDGPAAAANDGGPAANDVVAAAAHLKGLLSELRTHSFSCPELYGNLAANNSLCAIKTLDDLRAYPYARFLIQFYDFFFPRSSSCPDTTRPASAEMTASNSGGSS